MESAGTAKRFSPVRALLRLYRVLYRNLVATHLEDLSFKSLLQAMYRQALLDLFPFVQNGEILDTWYTAPLPLRARALSAALFLAQGFPPAETLARRFLGGMRRDEAIEMLLMNQLMQPWYEDIPAICYRCGRERESNRLSPKSWWRQIFPPPENLPEAFHWRYTIPENHVPLCRTCAAFAWSWEDTEVRVLWGKAVWGVRFDAWERLHLAFARGVLSHRDWDKENSPLWPPKFAPSEAKDWGTGKGLLALRYPYPSSIRHQIQHRRAACELLRRFPLAPRRYPSSLLVSVAALAPSPKPERGPYRNYRKRNLSC